MNVLVYFSDGTSAVYNMDDKVAREYIAEMDKTTSLEEALPLMVKMNDIWPRIGRYLILKEI